MVEAADSQRRRNNSSFNAIPLYLSNIRFYSLIHLFVMVFFYSCGIHIVVLKVAPSLQSFRLVRVEVYAYDKILSQG